MKSIQKLYLIHFLLGGISFAAGMTLFDAYRGDKFSLGNFLVLMIIFGVSMSYFSVRAAKDRLAQYGIMEINNSIFKLRHVKEVNSSITNRELMSRLKSDKIFGKTKIIETEYGIKIKTKSSKGSFGEIIRIRVKDIDGVIKSFQVSSKPQLPFRLLDYGINKENVDQIELIITNTA